MEILLNLQYFGDIDCRGNDHDSVCSVDCGVYSVEDISSDNGGLASNDDG